MTSGSYNLENKETKQYQEFTTPYAGLNQVLRPDGVYQSQQRFGMYRWHITDPIRFQQDLRVTIQALAGAAVAAICRSRMTLLPSPSVSDPADRLFPALPDRDELEVI
ncbi:MAG: DUF2961 domain-containing protein [Caldilineaceae bacterium]